MTRDSEACRRVPAPSDPSRRWSREQAPGAEKNHPNSQDRDRVDGASRGRARYRSFHRSVRPDLNRRASNGPFQRGGRRSRHSRRRRLGRCAGSSANRKRSPQRRLLRFETTATSQTRPCTHPPRQVLPDQFERPIPSSAGRKTRVMQHTRHCLQTQEKNLEEIGRR